MSHWSGLTNSLTNKCSYYFTEHIKSDKNVKEEGPQEEANAENEVSEAMLDSLERTTLCNRGTCLKVGASIMPFHGLHLSSFILMDLFRKGITPLSLLTWISHPFYPIVKFTIYYIYKKRRFNTSVGCELVHPPRRSTESVWQIMMRLYWGLGSTETMLGNDWWGLMRGDNIGTNIDL